MSEYSKQSDSCRLTTAEILYNLPDQPHLLRSFVWQDYDRAPTYPELQRFLEFWSIHIEGTLHSVRVESLGIEKPPGLVYAESSFVIH